MGGLPGKAIMFLILPLYSPKGAGRGEAWLGRFTEVPWGAGPQWGSALGIGQQGIWTVARCTCGK